LEENKSWVFLSRFASSARLVASFCWTASNWVSFSLNRRAESGTT
jgi:hypothetical protein